MLVGVAEWPTETVDEVTLTTAGGLTGGATLNGVDAIADTEEEPLELTETAAVEAASSEVTCPAWDFIPASDSAPWLATFSACSRATCKIIHPIIPTTSNILNEKDERTRLIPLFQFNEIPSTLQVLSILIPL